MRSSALKRGGCKVIVCVDSECTDPKITRNNLAPCIKRFSGFQIPIHFLVVVHTLETWLTADAQALKAVLGGAKGIRIPGNLEQNCKPAELLKDFFRKNGKRFIKSHHDQRIAEHANIEVILKKCSSFREFKKLLLE